MNAQPRDRSVDNTGVGRVYYSTDPHFGDEKNAARRGFASAAEHDQHLIAVMQRRLRDKDIVYFGGDLAVSNHQYALDMIATLPGTKHLIFGNHDPGHPMHRSATGAQLRRYLDVFETASPFNRRQVAGVEFAVSHFPYSSWGDGDGRESSRHHQWRLPESDYPLVHGHTHGKERAHGFQFHAGWDAWGDLVPEETIIDWVRTLNTGATA